MTGETIGYVINDYVPALIERIHECNANDQAIQQWAASDDESQH